MTKGGDGLVPCAAVRQKLSKAARNRKHTKESKRKISEASKGKNNPFYGKHHSLKTLKKMSGKRCSVTGEKNPQPKLSQQQVLEIYDRVLLGESQRKLAAEFEITQTQIWRIKHRKAWSHLLHGSSQRL